MPETKEVRGCPFPNCDWETEFDPEDYSSTLNADFESERHYEKEHAGRVRIQITIEKEQMLGGRTPREIREAELDRWEEKPYGVAYIRTEVLEEQDDHSQLGGKDDD